MTIYLDYIFLENLIVNIIIHLATIKLINIKIKKRHILIYSIIYSLFICLITYLNINNYIFVLLFTIIEMYMITLNYSLKYFIKAFIIYCLSYCIFIGLVIVSTIIFKINLNHFICKIITFIVCGIVQLLFTNNLWKMWKINLESKYLYYNLKIDNEIVPVFIDTGNSVKDVFLDLDVVFLSSALKNKLLDSNKKQKKRNLVISSINNESFVDGYIFENVEVYKEDKYVATIEKIIISFKFNNTHEKYSGIIGYETYLKYLEGV